MVAPGGLAGDEKSIVVVITLELYQTVSMLA